MICTKTQVKATANVPRKFQGPTQCKPSSTKHFLDHWIGRTPYEPFLRPRFNAFSAGLFGSGCCSCIFSKPLDDRSFTFTWQNCELGSIRSGSFICRNYRGKNPALHEVACRHNSKNIQHENLWASTTVLRTAKTLSDPSSGSVSLLSEASKRMLKNHHHHHHQMIKIRPTTSPIVAAQIIIRSSSGQYNGHVSATNVWFGPKPYRTSPQCCRQVSALLSSSLSSCIRANLSSNTEKLTDRMLTAIPALRMKIFQKQAIWDSQAKIHVDMHWGDAISIDISNRAYNQLHCKVWCSVRGPAHCIAHLYTDIYSYIYIIFIFLSSYKAT